jgi:hypothetical protein
MKQRLPLTGKVPDRRLSFGRGQPVHEGHGFGLFHMLMLCRIDQDNAVLIEKPGIAFDH